MLQGVGEAPVAGVAGQDDAAAAGGEAASAAGDAASVGGNAASVGGDATSVGGDASSLGNQAVKAGLRVLGNQAKTDGQKSFVKGLQDGNKIFHKAHKLQDGLNKLTNGPNGNQNSSNYNNQVGTTDPLEGPPFIQRAAEMARGQLANAPQTAPNPLSNARVGIVENPPESPKIGTPAVEGLQEAVEEQPEPFDTGYRPGSGSLKL